METLRGANHETSVLAQANCRARQRVANLAEGGHHFEPPQFVHLYEGRAVSEPPQSALHIEMSLSLSLSFSLSPVAMCSYRCTKVDTELCMLKSDMQPRRTRKKVAATLEADLAPSCLRQPPRWDQKSPWRAQTRGVARLSTSGSARLREWELASSHAQVGTPSQRNIRGSKQGSPHLSLRVLALHDQWYCKCTDQPEDRSESTLWLRLWGLLASRQNGVN